MADSDSSYHNFDLFFQREGDAYRVRADSDEGQAGNTFSLPFSDMELENFLLTTRPGRRGVRRVDAPDVAAAKRFGGNLFGAVFGGDVQGCWRSSLSAASQGGSRLRVRLRFTDTPELADLPWEYLFSPSLNRFLALDDELAIVRYLDMPERTRPVAVTLPLRVLTVISNPADFPRLDVEQEWANMQEALAPLQELGLLQIDLLEDATLPALRKKLQATQYQILHFIGHGAFDRQTQEGVVVLKDENGRGRLVSGQHLGWLLHNYRTLALVIINACEGGRADRTDAFAGTAQSLVQQGIPAAVAMQFEITDGAAKIFSQAFYTAIADARSVENALFEARMAVFAEGHELEWATPVLYMRAPNGNLFDISGTTAPAKPEPAPEPAEKQKAKLIRAAEPLPVPIAQPAPMAMPTQEAKPEGPKPADVQALFAQAQEAAKRGDEAAAIAKAKAILALDPWHADSMALLRQALQQQELARLYNDGYTHYQAGRWPEALAALSQVRGRDPGYRDISALIASTEARIAEAQRQATVVRPPVNATRERTLAGNFPPWIKFAAPAVLALVLLLVVVVMIAPGLYGSNIAVPTATPVSSALSELLVSPTVEAPTDTPEAGNSVDNTPEPASVTGGAAKQAFDGTLKIGLDESLSGAEASFGLPFRNGVQLAIDDVNDRGGVEVGGKYYSLEMEALDDALAGVHDPAQGVKNAQTLIADPDVMAMVGPSFSSVAVAQMPLLNNAGLAQISVGATNETLTKPEYGRAQELRPTGKVTFFRLLTTNDVEGLAAADYMYDVFHRVSAAKIYILDDGESYGKSLADSVEKEFQARGGLVLGHESVAKDTTDFTAILTKIAATQPDALFYGGTTSNNLALARKQMRDAGLDVPFIGGDGIADSEFATQVGGASGDSYAAVVGVNALVLPTAKDFLSAYQARFGEAATTDSAEGYEAANMIIDAIKRAGSADREAVRAAIAATKDYNGVLGTTSFDENGDTTNRWVSVYQVVDGKWKFIDQFQYSGQ